MRVSVDPSDVGFVQDSFRYRVSLDDETMEDCITADEEKGEVLCFERDEQRRIIVADDGESAKTIIRTGVVKVWLVPDENDQPV